MTWRMATHEIDVLAGFAMEGHSCMLCHRSENVILTSHSLTKYETPFLFALIHQYFQQSDNTLLCTSLCCDELARCLEDDFVKVYGNNFNLGGVSSIYCGCYSYDALGMHCDTYVVHLLLIDLISCSLFTFVSSPNIILSARRISFCWQHWIRCHVGPHSR